MHWQCWQGISFLWKPFLFISNLTHQLPNFKLQQMNKCIDKTSTRCNYHRWKKIHNLCSLFDMCCCNFDMFLCLCLPPTPRVISAGEVGEVSEVTPGATWSPLSKQAREWKHVSEVSSVKMSVCGDWRFPPQIFVSNGWLFTKYPSLNISINLHEFDTQKPSILAASQLRGIGWRSVRNAEKINPILK